MKAKRSCGVGSPIVNGFKRSAQALSICASVCSAAAPMPSLVFPAIHWSAWMTRELVRHGGSANLAETDELIGAGTLHPGEYQDPRHARSFLDQNWRVSGAAGWHGHNGEAIRAAGTIFAASTNIAVNRSALREKKDPEVRVDYAIDYAVPMARAGVLFHGPALATTWKASPGRSAAGANLILFTTGNGSITIFLSSPRSK